MAPIPPGFTLWAAGDGAGARLMLGAVWSGGKAAILAAAQKSESPWDTDLKGRDDKPLLFQDTHSLTSLCYRQCTFTPTDYFIGFLQEL